MSRSANAKSALNKNAEIKDLTVDVSLHLLSNQSHCTWGDIASTDKPTPSNWIQPGIYWETQAIILYIKILLQMQSIQAIMLDTTRHLPINPNR